MSKKHSDEVKRERLAACCQDLRVLAVCLVIGRKRICLRIEPKIPFVRKDSSDGKPPPPPRKPSVDVKKEKHRCAGAGGQALLHSACWLHAASCQP